jgi:hypothetical protein
MKHAVPAPSGRRRAHPSLSDDSYWRDMVAFTWNVHTAEGREAIGRMPEAWLHHAADPWQIGSMPVRAVIVSSAPARRPTMTGRNRPTTGPRFAGVTTEGSLLRQQRSGETVQPRIASSLRLSQ